MKNKKAQVGSSLTWFVATIVVFFFLLIFLVVFIAYMTKGSITGEMPSAEVLGSSSFQKSEEQRMLFVLFESEYQNRISFDIVYNFVKILEDREKNYERTKNFELLNKTIHTIHEKNKNLFNFFIFNKNMVWVVVDLSGYSEQKVIYYFRFPSNEEIEKKEESLDSVINLQPIYLFYFPEKSFVLISYIKKEYSQKNGN